MIHIISLPLILINGNFTYTALSDKSGLCINLNFRLAAAI